MIGWLVLACARPVPPPVTVPKTAALRIVVQDVDQRPIANAEVILGSELLIGHWQERYTDEAGEVRFLELPLGRYDVAVDVEGFRIRRVLGLELAESKAYRATLDLEAANVGLARELLDHEPPTKLFDPHYRKPLRR